MIVDAALEGRAVAGDPVKVGIVGAGFAARGLVHQVLTATPGMEIVAVCNRTGAHAEQAYRDACSDSPTVRSWILVDVGLPPDRAVHRDAGNAPEAIAGALVVSLRRVPDERGTIFHMLRSTDEHFVRFGEIYFTTIYREVVKGWHKHTEMTLNYACIFGRIKLVLYDDREESPTKRALQEIFLGPDNHSLVVIPPGVWSGFKGMSDPFAIVANCCTHPHDPSRTTRLDPLDNDIPYDWATRHH